jgi:hypothetical protein
MFCPGTREAVRNKAEQLSPEPHSRPYLAMEDPMDFLFTFMFQQNGRYGTGANPREPGKLAQQIVRLERAAVCA